MGNRWAPLSLGWEGIPQIPWVEFLQDHCPSLSSLKGKGEGEQKGRDPPKSKWGDSGAAPGTRNELVCGQPMGEFSGPNGPQLGC